MQVFSCEFCEISKKTFSYRTPPVAASVLVLYLFITHPCIFFNFHQVVRKPFKFINNGLQTNETLVTKRTSPVFSRYFCIHFRPSLGKVLKQFLYKYQYQCILILIWEFRWCKKEANRKTEILCLLFTLLT